jgi:hypothetical protein
MFERFRKWFTQHRAWRSEHEAAWAPVKLKGPDQLTSFQHQCSEALAGAVPGLTFERKTGQKELYLVADLPKTKAQVFVYEDGSNIHEAGRDFVAEEWDFKTPADLIAAVVLEAKSRVAI